jgi:hypothetical protein
MTDDDSVLEDKWYENVLAAAKHLALCHSYSSQSGSNRGIALSSPAATVTFETPEIDFMQNRGGVILVDICQDAQYAVVVETNNGLTSIKPRKKNR